MGREAQDKRKGCPFNGLKASGARRDQSTVKAEENERTINVEQGKTNE